ncbi:hypothetical protein [Desulforhabdus sp. TSK]|uniref:hypothetical protein n=1 Tax=Desulforhabdus sp. TSK TaxID=2925014 RepID=UPI001FC8C455|nr:hypothetical protein [Desulforhabdus sp. TSK]GKT09129.1 hypothetical protein DSTSK_24340 [Desulforhabdus sp. TSK]
MKRLQHTGILSAIMLALVLSQSGCVHNVPLNVAPATRELFPNTEKIHAKVGVYFSDDLRNYVCKQNKMGMVFQMEVGKYMVPIAMQMISSLFDEAVEVNSLPPYMGNYQPDVEAVIEPEILYAYGNAIGTLSGEVEAKVRFRIKGYDLSGNVVWEGNALGESRSGQIDFVTTFLTGMDKVGQVGYQAGLSAAQQIVNEFNSSRPPELYALLEMKTLAKSKSRKSVSNSELFENLYQKGMYHFNKKNFQQALYGFQKAEGINGKDPLAQFYVGVCYIFTGRREKALAKLESVMAGNPKDNKLASDCKKWIERLNDPLNIAFVIRSDSKNPQSDECGKILSQALSNSGMYEIVRAGDSKSSASPENSNQWNAYLASSSREGAKIVLSIQSRKESMVATEPGRKEGDFATLFEITTKTEAYGASKKKLVAEFTLTDTAARIDKQTPAEKTATETSLMRRNADRIVLNLLKNEIF